MKPGIDYIGIGCGCIIINNKNEVLLVKRSKKVKAESTGAGLWSRPGGTVDFGENVEDALRREMKEELNIDIEIIRLLKFDNDIKIENGIKNTG